MSSVSQIRTAIQTTLQSYLGASVYINDTVPGITELPGIAVEPTKSYFEMAFGRGTDEWHFFVYVFCSRADEKNGQNTLDEFVTGAGPKSVRQAIATNPTLGLADCTASVKGMRGYGGTTKEAGMGVVGAYLHVVVYTSGTS